MAEAGDTGSAARIIEAARDEFVESGLAGARVDRIAHRAHCNKAMIYYHFHSKEKLYQVVLEDSLRNALGRLKSKLSESASLEEALGELVAMHMHLFRDVPGFREMALRELANPTGEMFDRIRDTIEASDLRTHMRGLFQKSFESGQLRRVDPRQAIIAFVSMSIGYFLIAPMADRIVDITDREEFLEQRKKAVVDIFLNGIKAR